MNKLVLIAIMLATVYTLWRHGIAKTFVYIYLPALLFLYVVPFFPLPSIPNLSISTAVGYPMLLAIFLLWHEVRRLKFNIFDGMILLMMLPPTMSALANDTLWDAISKTGELFFLWVLPYFAGRMVLIDADARRAAFKVLCICAIIIGGIALIEFRLRPYMYARAMQQIGLSDSPTATLFTRFGFMRAQSTMGHSIDLGNCGVLLGSMILMLFAATGRHWTSPLTIAGLCGAGMMVVSSISFTSLNAMMFAFILFFAFTRPVIGRWLPLPAVLAVMLTIVTLMTITLSKEISTDGSDVALFDRSKWQRERIIQDSWVKVPDAGLFGTGRRIDTTDIGSGSVDNAYILFILQNGWIHLAMWIILALVVGYKGIQLLGKANTPSERIPVAAALAGTIAIFFAMYTVFYGFVYAVLFCVMIGMLGTMTQLFSQRYASAVPVAGARGFAPVSHGALAHAGGRR